MHFETVWTFKTARFCVSLDIARDYGYQYDGDDENGETQAALDSGEMIAFDSRVIVTMDGMEVGADHLGGSVYYANDVGDFWTAHRDADPFNRNCTIGAIERGGAIVGHYFPDMIRTAISEARATLANLPTLRAA